MHANGPRGATRALNNASQHLHGLVNVRGRHELIDVATAHADVATSNVELIHLLVLTPRFEPAAFV